MKILDNTAVEMLSLTILFSGQTLCYQQCKEDISKLTKPNSYTVQQIIFCAEVGIDWLLKK